MRQLICLCLSRVRFLASNEVFFILDATCGTPVWEIVAFMCNEIPGSKRATILPAFFCVVEANAHGVGNLHDLHVQVSPDIDGHLQVMASHDLGCVWIRLHRAHRLGMVVIIVLLPGVIWAVFRAVLSDIRIQLFASPQIAPERLSSLYIEEISRPRELIPASSCVSGVPLRVGWRSHKNKQEVHHHGQW